MPRKRLTNHDLDHVSRVASAREYVRLAESSLPPSATDREVLAHARDLQSLPLETVRTMNLNRDRIASQTKRLAAFDGAEDPWVEAGPDQPDPTNNQAYTKQIQITPDHAVQESLQKRDVHAPTASRAKAMSARARQKWGAAAPDEEEDEADRRADYDDPESLLPEEGPPRHLRDDDEEEDLLPDDLDGDGDVDEDDLGLHDGVDDDLGDDLLDEMDDDVEFGDEEDSDPGEDDLDDLMGVDEDEFGDEMDPEHGPDVFDFDDEDEDEEGRGRIIHPGMDDFDDADLPVHHAAKAPQASRRSRSASRAPAPKQGKRRASSSGSASRLSLDDILNIHEEDIERTASSPLDPGDLEALLGAKVTRSGNRVASSGGPSQREALERRRAMFENVWDTQDDPELTGDRKPRRSSGRKRVASGGQGRPAQSKPAQSKPARGFAPDRRRIVTRATHANEFDSVWNVPDVAKYFD